MNTVMIFVLVLLSSGNRPTGLELYFQELTSCLEYRDALVYQSVHKHNFTRGETRYFKAYCEVRVIPANEAGSKYLFRDPMIKKEEDE